MTHIKGVDNQTALCGEQVCGFMFEDKEHALIPQRLVPCKKCLKAAK
jgi:hypothetical protein